MYINNIILYLYIIIYIQFVNALEEGVVLRKDEVLKITNEYYISFFCKMIHAFQHPLITVIGLLKFQMKMEIW